MTETTAVATRETYAEETKDQGSLVRLWLDAIELASTEEETWRKKAQETFDLYLQSSGKDGQRTDANKKFNILHSNIETLAPALYNSTPVPDVRRRFNDADPVGKVVADIQERCLTYSVESYDFDHTMKLAVKDSEIAGRAVTRIRYKPYVAEDGNSVAYQEVTCEHVPWKHFRRGPAQVWDDCPWEAFELFLTRDELVKLNKTLGNQVKLDVTLNDADKKDSREVPEVFKRARVWEIWDKDHRQVLFIAESLKTEPLVVVPDPLELEGFFCTPRPLYSIQTSTSLVPVVPYEIYKAQAEELELVSKRIQVLTEAVKAKALYDARITEMERLEKADDADNIPIENVSIFADGTGLDKHVLWYPIEVITAALEKLYIARDQIKQTIYEITGIADILRGATEASETATAQQIKTQWGSLRIQDKQKEIQRYARDLFRLKAEIFASKFEWPVLSMMTGIQLPSEADKQKAKMIAAQMQQMQQQLPPEIQSVLGQPSQEEVERLLRSDKLRSFRVDIESDSTIRADLTRNQQNMSLFLQGVAQYAQAMGPIVMADKALMPAALQVFVAFARNFKLGRSAEDAIEKVITQAEQQAQLPPPPPPELQIEQERLKMEKESKAAELQFKQAESEQKLQFEREKHQQEMEFKAQEHQNDMAMRGQEMQMKQVEGEQNLQLKEKEMQVRAAEGQQSLALKKAEGEQALALKEREMDQSTTGVDPKALSLLQQVARQLDDAIQEMNAPAEIVRGADGRAAGVKRGSRVRMIIRGEDGRAAGIH